jgi:hypothetical protein
MPPFEQQHALRGIGVHEHDAGYGEGHDQCAEAGPAWRGHFSLETRDHRDRQPACLGQLRLCPSQRVRPE